MSTLRVTTLQNSGGTKSVSTDTVVDGTAKAWVNFNGSGVVSIRAQFNVSSITDINTGQYSINFTTALTDANYSAVVSTSEIGGGGSSSVYAYIADGQTVRTTSAVRISSLINNGASFFDSQYLSVTISR
jgi:hypothetical protein